MSESFVVQVEPRADELVVRPVGVLGESTIGALDRAIDASIVVEPDRIAVDLAGVTRLDLDGLSSLLRARIVARAHEVPLRFATPSASCRRLVERASLHDLLGFQDA